MQLKESETVIHLAIIPTHVTQGDHLRKNWSESKFTVDVVARRRVVEVHAERLSKQGTLLGGCKYEHLCDCKRDVTLCTGILGQSNV